MSTYVGCDLASPYSVLRSNIWGHPYRITETSPQHDGTPESLIRIIRWLGVEKGLRWKPLPGATYCNVYATDYAHACGVYLPRVWWTQSAEKEIVSGKSVVAQYGTTAMELSANALFRWLSGPASAAFGWRKTTLTDAQDSADKGMPSVLCCRKKVESSPGHIAVVAPQIPGIAAVRDQAGEVTLPVLSQAGAKNEELGVASSWWLSPSMADWGVWVCDTVSL